MRHKSNRWITEPHLIQIVFLKPHDKSNSLLLFRVVVIFFCMWSHYTAMPPHTPPPRRILIIQQSPSITPLYNAQGVRSYRHCLLSQQGLLRHLIGLLGCDFLVSYTIKNYPTRTQVWFLGELIELRTIINCDLHSVVSSGCNHLYVSGLWCDTHFLASTFISSSGCCSLGGIEG